MGVLQQTTFYSIIDQTFDGSAFSVNLWLNAEHSIHQAHFPQRAITPGVCSIELLKEVVGELTIQELTLIKCPLVKFIRLIEPHVTPVITLQGVTRPAEPSGLLVTATIQVASEIYCKLAALIDRI